MAKKSKNHVWHKKSNSMISSKYLKAQKSEKDSTQSPKQKSAAQAYADKFTLEIKKAFQ